MQAEDPDGQGQLLSVDGDRPSDPARVPLGDAEATRIEAMRDMSGLRAIAQAAFGSKFRDVDGATPRQLGREGERLPESFGRGA